jgi:hypothetical protein
MHIVSSVRIHFSSSPDLSYVLNRQCNSLTKPSGNLFHQIINDILVRRVGVVSSLRSISYVLVISVPLLETVRGGWPNWLVKGFLDEL